MALIASPELDRIIKALDDLFSDGGIHPVVFRQARPGNTLSEPIVEPTLRKCRKCVEALFEVSEAYCAYRVQLCKEQGHLDDPRQGRWVQCSRCGYYLGQRVLETGGLILSEPNLKVTKSAGS
jgi:ribosomal protein L37E